MKNSLYDVGHMTKMAAMPIYGKNPSKIFSGFQPNFESKLTGSGKRKIINIMLVT